MTILDFARKLLIIGEKRMNMRYLIYLLIMVSASLSAGEILKWTDDDGNIYYGDSPPIEANAEPVKVIGAPSNPGKALPRLSDGTGSGSSGSGSDQRASNQQSGNTPADQAKIACEYARSDLKVIGSSTRIRLKAVDGSVRYMSAEEIDARKQSAEEDIAQFC
jgi:hypothetical protein